MEIKMEKLNSIIQYCISVYNSSMLSRNTEYIILNNDDMLSNMEFIHGFTDKDLSDCLLDPALTKSVKILGIIIRDIRRIIRDHTPNDDNKIRVSITRIPPVGPRPESEPILPPGYTYKPDIDEDLTYFRNFTYIGNAPYPDVSLTEMLLTRLFHLEPCKNHNNETHRISYNEIHYIEAMIEYVAFGRSITEIKFVDHKGDSNKSSDYSEYDIYEIIGKNVYKRFAILSSENLARKTKSPNNLNYEKAIEFTRLVYKFSEFIYDCWLGTQLFLRDSVGVAIRCYKNIRLKQFDAHQYNKDMKNETSEIRSGINKRRHNAKLFSTNSLDYYGRGVKNDSLDVRNSNRLRITEICNNLVPVLFPNNLPSVNAKITRWVSVSKFKPDAVDKEHHSNWDKHFPNESPDTPHMNEVTDSWIKYLNDLRNNMINQSKIIDKFQTFLSS
jgi:hypothetical protein